MTLRFFILAMLVSTFSLKSYAKDREAEAMANSVLGTWQLYLPSPSGVEKVTAYFQGEPGNFSGELENQEGKKSLENVKIEGVNFSFQHDIEKFFMSFTLTFEGSVSKDQLSGYIDTPKGPKAFEGIRITKKQGCKNESLNR